jgi:hypothetical protein
MGRDRLLVERASLARPTPHGVAIGVTADSLSPEHGLSTRARIGLASEARSTKT